MSSVRETSRLSQSDGMPVRPRRAEAGPSCICPPLKSESSCAWMADEALADLDVLQRAPGDRRRGQRVAVVAEADGAGGAELAHLGELLALEALGDGGEEADRDDRVARGLPDEALEQAGVVDDRVGVGHAEGGHVAAGRGGGRGGREVLFVLATRRAEVRVQVDEARQDEHAGGVDHAGVLAGLEVLADLGDLALLDEHVLHGVDAGLGVDDAAALDQQLGGREGLAPRPFHQSTSPLAAPSL